MVASMPFAFNRIRYGCFSAISPGWISLELGLSTLNQLRQATAETLWLFLYQDMWSKEEIKAIEELLKLIKANKNRDIYLKSLEDIVIAKEKLVNEYIQKVSTTY